MFETLKLNNENEENPRVVGLTPDLISNHSWDNSQQRKVFALIKFLKVSEIFYLYLYSTLFFPLEEK
jgi:hypothetical protein